MAWDIAHSWDTGDINSRLTQALAIIDKDHDGTPYIIAPIAHGVRCYDPEGNLEWSYSGITQGYDVRDIAVGNLNGTGYNDCVVIASGYYTTTSHGNVAVVDKDGNELQLLLGSDFTSSVARCTCVAVDGTDIYVSGDFGITKFVKSGSEWVEDSENWNKTIGSCWKIAITDMGNGKRVYVACSTNTQGVYCYQTDGTHDWTVVTGNQYTSIFDIGKSDSTKTGLQIAIPYQGGIAIADKDGNLSQLYNAHGSNVRGSVIFYDCDGDGEDEIYFTDMARDVYCIEKTGTNTYSLKYSLLDAINSGQYAGLAHFDINNDGDDEIFIYTTDGYCLIYDKTLSTEIKSLNIGHGQTGGQYTYYQFLGNGIEFVDIDGDGHEDLVIAGATGYVDVFVVDGIEGEDPPPDEAQG
ncbi:MAG TPA: FG-GAP-like repeat-containing protein, partial [Fervidobacterium sp.]|nr:FG-GAP-like repeat-containing protein [Fervidobacterium sp.]